MIEVEKNFDLKPGEKERLIQGANLVNQITFTDVYYDNANYDLTRRDYWLRARDGRFELKAPLNVAGINREATDRYRELETEKEIAAELRLETKTNLVEALLEAGYKPFATITTHRERYQKDGFYLDFDEVKELNYTTFELELGVATPAEILAAEKRILDFAKEYGITKPGRGKVIEYLLKHNPAHYEVLKKAGVIRD